jgi:dsRNA-specific ribonuclease
MGQRQRKARARHRPGKNYRYRLELVCEAQSRPEPRYEVVASDTEQITVALYLGAEKVCEAVGPSEDKAQQYAARDALTKLTEG